MKIKLAESVHSCPPAVPELCLSSLCLVLFQYLTCFQNLKPKHNHTSQAIKKEFSFKYLASLEVKWWEYTQICSHLQYLAKSLQDWEPKAYFYEISCNPELNVINDLYEISCNTEPYTINDFYEISCNPELYVIKDSESCKLPPCQITKTAWNWMQHAFNQPGIVQFSY